MRFQSEISDLTGHTPRWDLIRIKLMAVIASYWPERHNAQYRPERHYMRGPGPKWREKHGRSAHSPERSQAISIQDVAN
jgi:hypothetical protein